MQLDIRPSLAKCGDVGEGVAAELSALFRRKVAIDAEGFEIRHCRHGLKRRRIDCDQIHDRQPFQIGEAGYRQPAGGVCECLGAGANLISHRELAKFLVELAEPLYAFSIGNLDSE